MDGLTRRRMLLVGGGALGALGLAGPARASAGADPKWVWDEEADPLVASLLDRGDVPKVNKLLKTWTRNDQPLPDGLPPDLRGFMTKARQLPVWARQSKLEAAADFHKSRAFYLDLLNGPGSGILSTAIPKEARAVYHSKGGANMNDRVAKTSLFGFAVGSLNGYRPEGKAVVTSVKTRLVHAAVRHLLPRSPQWAQTGGGLIPISQNDMLVTWHTLPTYVMRKLIEWRVPIASAQSDAYLHLWQVTAHMLGIRDEFIPQTWDAANAQSDQVLPPAMGPTREGVSLTDTLLGMLAEQTSPGGLNRPMVNALSRYLVGDQVADWNGIPREPVWDPLVRSAFPKLVAFREKLVPLPLVPEVAWVLEEAARGYILFYLTQGQPVDIDIPETNRPTR
ncbi:Latex clearing protein [Actinosynnema sp. ALI-1.44]|uniref:oxygenase MpaB family protein n=1 Tax=Actinosynnema sp. ALI-1.44 TaxID=1933779 RepID=UPI00097BE3EB|nr:oxygenase MpaB family protein [Actinosynnema sp. ALI-1.44]ONI75193.1 Latex clearing protein [Actinosynnema sp. ALI-1.44]